MSTQKTPALTGIIFFMMLSISAFTQTIVTSGYVSGRWTKANSPYQVKGMIQIPSDSTLILEPGVVIDFQGPYKLNVKGRILSIGLPNDSIYFTTTNVLQDSMPGVSGHWTGIEFLSLTATNDTSFFVYCNVYGAGGDDISNTQALSITQWSKVKVYNCFFDRNNNAAIYTYGCSPEIKRNTITRSGKFAISASDGLPRIESNYIVNNKGAGIYLWWSSASVVNNVIVNNGTPYVWNGGGIRIEGYGRPFIGNNTIVNNFNYNQSAGMYIQSLTAGRDPSVQPIIANNIIRGNASQGGPSQIFIAHDESDPDFYNNNIQGGLSGFSVDASAIFNGKYQLNIDTVPMFQVNQTAVGYQNAAIPGLSNWALMSNSGCIDKGSTTLPYTDKDIAGNPRANVCRIDMGAFEYQKGSALIVNLQVQQPKCYKEKNGWIQASVSGGAPPYNLLWNKGGSGYALSNLDSGTYTLTVTTTADGCAISKTATLYRPDSFYVILTNDTNVACKDSFQLKIVQTNYPLPGNLSYQWFPSTQLSSATAPKPFFKFQSPQTILLTATTLEGCKLTDSIRIYGRPLGTSELCVVTIDSNNHNVIVWNKDSHPLIEKYRLRKETNVSGNYQLLIEQPVSAFSVFTDTNSNAAVQSNTYKLEFLDQCGMNSIEGAAHKTMHLTINKGVGNTWNLIWEKYTGVTVNTYNIYRGATPLDLQLIGTSSGTNTQYSDLNAPAGDLLYQIEVVLGNNCSPSKTYNSSRSNIASTAQAGLETLIGNALISLVPNPASEAFSIYAPELTNRIEAIVYDANGKRQIAYDQLYSGSSCSISMLPEGIYLIMVRSGSSIWLGKLAVVR